MPPATEPPPTAMAPPPRPRAQRMLRNVVGVLVIVLAVTDLFVPILHAVLMVAVGLWLVDLPIKRRAHDHLLRYAWYRRVAASCRAWLDSWRGDAPR